MGSGVRHRCSAGPAYAMCLCSEFLIFPILFAFSFQSRILVMLFGHVCYYLVQLVRRDPSVSEALLQRDRKD